MPITKPKRRIELSIVLAAAAGEWTRGFDIADATSAAALRMPVFVSVASCVQVSVVVIVAMSILVRGSMAVGVLMFVRGSMRVKMRGHWARVYGCMCAANIGRMQLSHPVAQMLYGLGAFAGQRQNRPTYACALGIRYHLIDIDIDMLGQIDFVDDQQISAADAGSAFASYVTATGDIQHEHLSIYQCW